jgi:hypothetical protein
MNAFAAMADAAIGRCAVTVHVKRETDVKM